MNKIAFHPSTTPAVTTRLPPSICKKHSDLLTTKASSSRHKLKKKKSLKITFISISFEVAKGDICAVPRKSGQGRYQRYTREIKGVSLLVLWIDKWKRYWDWQLFRVQFTFLTSRTATSYYKNLFTKKFAFSKLEDMKIETKGFKRISQARFKSSLLRFLVMGRPQNGLVEDGAQLSAGASGATSNKANRLSLLATTHEAVAWSPNLGMPRSSLKCWPWIKPAFKS